MARTYPNHLGDSSDKLKSAQSNNMTCLFVTSWLLSHYTLIVTCLLGWTQTRDCPISSRPRALSAGSGYEALVWADWKQWKSTWLVWCCLLPATGQMIIPCHIHWPHMSCYIGHKAWECSTYQFIIHWPQMSCYTNTGHMAWECPSYQVHINWPHMSCHTYWPHMSCYIGHGAWQCAIDLVIYTEHICPIILATWHENVPSI